jgi:hypothetical protein
MYSTSLFLPQPINIYTFVRYFVNGDHEDIGLIEDINLDSHSVTIRRFMTWLQVSTVLGEHLMHDVTFWTNNSERNPIYLCDSDLFVTQSLHSINGIAFVFQYDDPVVAKISGLGNTYVVSSVFNSFKKSIIHGPSFRPFPCTYCNPSFVSCFPSLLFRQLLGIKQRVRCLMNTRSMAARCIQSCVINNIDPLTWYYIQVLLGVPVLRRSSVQKQYFVCQDEFVLEKYRSEEFIIEHTLPEHLFAAQKLFGSAVGIGTRQVIRCSLKRRGIAARQVSYQQIRYDNEFNIIPFEMDTEVIEVCRRGIQLKYVARELDLHVTVRYRKMIGRHTIETHFQVRSMLNSQLGILSDAYPLHVDTSVFGAAVREVSLMTQLVTLSNNTVFHINDVIREIDRLI